MSAVKTKAQIEKIRTSGKVVARCIRMMSEAIVPGKTTPAELDALAAKVIAEAGGVPSFLNYRGFPANTCISVNKVVVHGIPNGIPLQEGDIVSLDVGVMIDGWHADGAWTVPVGEVSPEARRLLNVTRAALDQGIAKARAGNRTGDIGHAVQRYVEANGYGVVRDLVGHGIGEHLHDEPHNVPNFGKPGKGDLLKEGMTICVEPMVNQGTYRVVTLPDGWTLETADGKLSAHFEHTVAVGRGPAEILTVE
jgi:methionyl aminopeptidase